MLEAVALGQGPCETVLGEGAALQQQPLGGSARVAGDLEGFVDGRP